jgi:hypothetical protein
MKVHLDGGFIRTEADEERKGGKFLWEGRRGNLIWRGKRGGD